VLNDEDIEEVLGAGQRPLESVDGSAVASGRRRPSYLRVGTVYRYPVSAVEAWIAESVRGSIAS
jgi:hypothetical protein